MVLIELAELAHTCFNEMPHMLRPVVVYVRWLASAGGTDGEETEHENALIPRMLRYHFCALAAVTVVLLFDHLREGVIDVPAFGIGSMQLLFSVSGLAVLNSAWRTERRAWLLQWAAHFSLACLVLDIVLSSLLIIDGHREKVVSLDLSLKIALYLYVTSLPFFALDRELAAMHSQLTFLWKIYVIEAVDFCTILYGAIQYSVNVRAQAQAEGFGQAHIWRIIVFDPRTRGGSSSNNNNKIFGFLDSSATAGTDDGDNAMPAAWTEALTTFIYAFAANAVLFGALASWLLSKVLLASVGEGRSIGSNQQYTFIAVYVFLLDTITDLPTWLVSLTTRAYVHNICLTFNVLINLLALVRGVYITIIACLADDLRSPRRGRSLHKGGSKKPDIWPVEEDDSDDDRRGDYGALGATATTKTTTAETALTPPPADLTSQSSRSWLTRPDPGQQSARFGDEEEKSAMMTATPGSSTPPTASPPSHARGDVGAVNVV